MTKLQSPILAWHFCGDTLRDGRPIPRKGVWLKHEGKCEMCESGLHASRRLIDALKYAPGNILCRVECRGIEYEHDDKLVCHERRIIARANIETLLRSFAHKCALDAIRLKDAPDIVVKYFKTGDESLKEAAAWISARAVAEDTAWAAARIARAAEAAVAATVTKQNEWLTREAKKLLRCK